MMSNFVIRKNQVNRIVATLSERSQLVDPYFLLVFSKNIDLSGITASVSVQNSVPQNIRYDLLEILETTSPTGS